MSCDAKKKLMERVKHLEATLDDALNTIGDVRAELTSNDPEFGWSVSQLYFLMQRIAKAQRGEK